MEAGEAIPSEIELAGRFRVSQGTVRKAIDELAAEHILVRRQGKGTYVASHSEPSYQYRFLRSCPTAARSCTRTPSRGLAKGQGQRGGRAGTGGEARLARSTS